MTVQNNMLMTANEHGASVLSAVSVVSGRIQTVETES